MISVNHKFTKEYIKDNGYENAIRSLIPTLIEQCSLAYLEEIFNVSKVDPNDPLDMGPRHITEKEYLDYRDRELVYLQISLKDDSI